MMEKFVGASWENLYFGMTCPNLTTLKEDESMEKEEKILSISSFQISYIMTK